MIVAKVQSTADGDSEFGALLAQMERDVPTGALY
jgi:hypothetical protein